MSATPAERRHSAYYAASASVFSTEDCRQVLGTLAAAHGHELDVEQKRAWEEEIGILRNAVRGLEGWLYLEFAVPRLGSRIDAVLVSGAAIFSIEFKCGEPRYHTADRNQVWDYALDLKNFHLASHNAPIFPVLVPTATSSGDEGWQLPHADGVRPPRGCRPEDLSRTIAEGLALVNGPPIDAEAWGSAPYHPTPTIIEAARALYSRHTVEAISRNDAGAKNLGVTSGAVEEIIEQSRARREKSVIFLTGVPGAGKTLVGLIVATQRRDFGDTRAVFLSGNGPLVAVLQEALTRDELRRVGNQVRKGVVRQQVKPFIQNVHHFRDEGLRTEDAPFDHVVIFDEAQRAWNKRKTADFMKRRKKRPDFNESEPEFLISYLDRHDDWAVVICLVGGGQEIYDGEAGIAEWLDAARLRYQNWQLYISPDLTDSEYAAGHALDAFGDDARVVLDSRLHLATSMRSFRSEKVSGFVKAVLDCDGSRAKQLLNDVSRTYPIAITRDLARESYRVGRRAHSGRGWDLWDDPASIPRRYVNVPSGWSSITRPSIRRSGPRFDRLARSSGSARNHCGAGCDRRSAIRANALG